MPRSQHGRNSQRGAETVKDIENAGGKARFIAADLSEADDVRRLATEAGAVDIPGQQRPPEEKFSCTLPVKVPFWTIYSITVGYGLSATDASAV